MTHSGLFFLLNALLLQGTLSNAAKNPLEKLLEDLKVTKMLGEIWSGLVDTQKAALGGLKVPTLAGLDKIVKPPKVENLEKVFSAQGGGKGIELLKDQREGLSRMVSGAMSANPILASIAEPLKDARKQAESFGRSIDRAAMPGGRFPIPQDPFRNREPDSGFMKFPRPISGSVVGDILPELEVDESGVKLTVRVPSVGNAPIAASVVKDINYGASRLSHLTSGGGAGISIPVPNGAGGIQVPQPGDLGKSAASIVGQLTSGGGARNDIPIPNGASGFEVPQPGELGKSAASIVGQLTGGGGRNVIPNGAGDIKLPQLGDVQKAVGSIVKDTNVGASAIGQLSSGDTGGISSILELGSNAGIRKTVEDFAGSTLQIQSVDKK